MAKVYNIMDRLVNVKPTVQIDEEHEYKINNTKNNAIYIQSLAKKAEKKKDDMEFIDKVIKASLGEEAFDYINSKSDEWSMEAYTTIINVILAAISNEDLEKVEEENQIKKESFRKKKEEPAV